MSVCGRGSVVGLSAVRREVAKAGGFVSKQIACPRQTDRRKEIDDARNAVRGEAARCSASGCRGPLLAGGCS